MIPAAKSAAERAYAHLGCVPPPAPHSFKRGNVPWNAGKAAPKKARNFAHEYAKEDASTREGAARVARKIKAFWRAKGFDVTMSVVEAGADGSQRPIFSARSNMHNAVPIKELPFGKRFAGGEAP